MVASQPRDVLNHPQPAHLAGVAVEATNPMAYALVHKDDTIDAVRSFGMDQWDIYFRPNDHDGYAIVDYCFSGPRPKVIQVTVEREETLNGPQPQFTEWHSIGHQEMPPAPLSYPVLVTSFGPGENCPEDTQFYVKGFNSTDGAKGWAAFFLTLVL
jgi:hypothetical protein